MEYRKFGNTDLKLSAITFGAWAIGGWQWGGADKKDAIDAVHAAIDRGVTTIDTAAIYGQGLSEERVGEAIKSKSRDALQILTKFGMRWDLEKGNFDMDSFKPDGTPIKIYRYAGKESVIYECEQSLKRLGTDYIDLYQQHWPDPTTPIEETMEALVQLKEQGKIREASVCNYSLEQLKEALKYIDLAGDQVPFSMLLRDYEKEVFPFALEKNLGILAYSPMQRGLLTGKFKPDQDFKEGDSRGKNKYFKPENIKRVNEFLEKIKPIAQAHKATLAQLVLRWTIDQPAVTVALAGARNQEQAIQNAESADMELTEEEMKKINDELQDLVLV